ncbi:gamma-glutamylcyclotransferase [Rossellomorea marisflavi]|uniref:gamma-glutamylcyclotransferase n=1 Tax=Rossellomorea marisflavi TaxID=189381 RepID=UPI00296F88AD|nr:gamma-glutamylcyclotransferase [Rossellomorea marisflavi]MDW4526955.1 gamma-glutamylcyclotransferase [Rossellomorea marisflavi]
MLIFVYGNLRKHECHHSLLQNPRTISLQAYVDGVLIESLDGQPVMTAGNEKVYGELYEVDRSMIDQLERMKEVIPAKAIQTEATVVTDHGSHVATVFAAASEDAQGSVIPSGDWKVKTFLENRPSETLYFAYGSCMDQERFKKAGVHIHFQDCLGAGIVQDFRMDYSFVVDDGGRGDITEVLGEVMEGVVYRVNQEAVDYLFEREGVLPGWYRPAFLDVTIDGRVYKDVLTFIVKRKSPETLPPEHYALEILRGSHPYVSEEYHRKLQDQLLRLGMDEERIRAMLHQVHALDRDPA